MEAAQIVNRQPDSAELLSGAGQFASRSAGKALIQRSQSAIQPPDSSNFGCNREVKTPARNRAHFSRDLQSNVHPIVGGEARIGNIRTRGDSG